jgi:hypothetical protein
LVSEHPLISWRNTDETDDCTARVERYGNITDFDMQEKLYELQTSFDEWISHRKMIIQELKQFVIELNEHHRKVNIAKITGTSFAIVGTALGTIGFVSAFFTAGLTLPLTIAGGVIGGIGGATTAGASIAEWRITKQKAKEIQEHLEKSPELFKNVQNHIKEIETMDPNLSFFAGKTVQSKMTSGATKVVNVATLAKCLGKDLIVDPVLGGLKIVNSLRGAASVVKDGTSLIGSTSVVGATTAFNIMKPASQAVFIGGFLFSALTTPIDIYFLVKDSKELYQKAPAELSKKFEPIIEKMENELNEFMEDMAQGHCEFNMDDDDHDEAVDMDMTWLK